MDLIWIWYGFLIIICLFLMLGVMWITDQAIDYTNKLWNKVFPPLNPM